MLYATSAAAYYVHIPAEMFGIGCAARMACSLRGIGDSAMSRLPRATPKRTISTIAYDENGAGSVPPLPATTGVSSGIINLSYGTMPLNTGRHLDLRAKTVLSPSWTTPPIPPA
jgi:hypothetical protein